MRRWSVAPVSVPGAGVYTSIHKSGACAIRGTLGSSVRRPTSG
jgi:hypothetical protein